MTGVVAENVVDPARSAKLEIDSTLEIGELLAHVRPLYL
jgi:hypothetical protein